MRDSTVGILSTLALLAMRPGAFLGGRSSIQFDPKDDADDGTDDDDAEDDDEPVVVPPKSKKEKKITKENDDRDPIQKKVDGAVAKERRALQEKHLKETQELLRDQELTKAQRNKLVKREEELLGELETEREKAQREVQRLKAAHTQEKSESEEKAKYWEDNFTKSTKLRAITDAAVLANAKNPKQIEKMLANDAHVVEIKDKKQRGTGQFIVVVPISQLNDETKQWETTDVPIDEYVESMAGSEEHSNLFNSERVSGTGARPNGGGGGGGGGGKLSPAEKINRGLRANGLR